jgi:hypothetical protein
MPTKRVKRTPARIGVSAEAAEAWRIGDWHAVNRAFGVLPCDHSPFDVNGSEPPEWERDRPWRVASRKRAWALRQALIEAAGPPGRVGRHGEPLGP